jgi:uncharacterized protein YbaP (TraB family)
MRRRSYGKNNWIRVIKGVTAGMALVALFATWASAGSSVWMVRKGNSVMYFGGTCHVLRESDFPLPPEFEKAYKASGVLVFETDIGKLRDPETQKRLLSRAMYGDGSTIDKHLSPRTYEELSSYCEANGIPLQALGRFRPSMLMVTLAVMELMKMGVTQQGVDQYFYDQALKDGKVVEGLETADEQIEYLVTMADGNEDDFVSYSLKDLKGIKENFDSIEHAWRTGDTKELDRIMIADLKTRWPKMYGKLIVERNRNWLRRIEGYRKTARTEFILVGVGHLVGPDGIIEALRKKGYRVNKL